MEDLLGYGNLGWFHANVSAEALCCIFCLMTVLKHEKYPRYSRDFLVLVMFSYT